MAERSDGIPGGESAAVQDFIRQRQADLLVRAEQTLRDCPDADLAAEAHRLSGTLGTYQLDDAQAALRTLENVVTSPTATATDVTAARATAVTVIRALVAAHHAESETPE